MFEFTPKLFILSDSRFSTSDGKPIIWFPGISTLTRSEWYTDTIVQDQKTLTWYCSSYSKSSLAPTAQFNISGTSYYYFAFGQ